MPLGNDYKFGTKYEIHFGSLIACSSIITQHYVLNGSTIYALNGLRVVCISNEWVQLRFLS